MSDDIKDARGQADELGVEAEDEAPEVLDLSLSVGELCSAHPKLQQALADVGLSDLDSAAKVPDVLQKLGVDSSLVVVALQSMGYEVTGFTPEKDPYAPEVGAILDALFNDDAPRSSATSVDPMVANMEAAVLRAQKNGKLPKVD